MKKPDLLAALRGVLDVFEQLAIPYYVGGSLASSAYGLPRTTMDADLVGDVTLTHVASLVRSLRDRYYVSEAMIARAIADVSSFNLIHLQTTVKIDVFILKKDAYHRSALARRVKDRLIDDDPASAVFLSSAEDVILSKLEWYEMGQRVSERQWLDVLGIIKVQGESLDGEYLVEWSGVLGVSELLRHAYQEAGVELC